MQETHRQLPKRTAVREDPPELAGPCDSEQLRGRDPQSDGAARKLPYKAGRSGGSTLTEETGAEGER